MRPQTRGEELANTILHGAGFLASVAALPLIITAAAGRRDAFYLVGSIIFGVTLVLLYLASTVYHALPTSRATAKHVCRVIDHAAIYLLIAGTYTPFALGALRGPWGWTMLGIIWALAITGIVLKLTVGFRYPRLSTLLYVAMGWMGALLAEPMLARISVEGVLWLLAGGLAYTGGVALYAIDSRVRFAHAGWHVCVLAGSTCHLVAVVRYSGSLLG